MVTVFPPDGGKLNELLTKSSNRIIYDSEKDVSQRSSSSTVPSLLNDTPFYEDIITENKPKVKHTNQIKISDESYLSAVRTGDTEKLQQMVDEAARQAGYTVDMWHGSPAQFTVFDRKKAKTMGAYGNGFYFTDSESNAGLYGNKYKVKLKIENPLKSGGSTATRDNLKKFIEAVAENEDYSIENYGTYDTEQILDMILEGNTEKDTFAVIQDVNATAIGNFAEAVELYNSTVGTTYDAIETPTETVVFNSEQIKSADPVTYDDDGNVIPLSKRFDSTKKDIRKQVKVKITESMSDEKREEILKDKRITVKHINSLSFSVTDEKSGTKISTWDDINSLTPNMKKKLIRKIADEFGAFKGYVNDSIDLSFVYSYNNYDESYGKQKKYYESFAKMYSVFDDVINNAIGIEAHLREGYKEDPTLEKVYILISAFSDGEYIIPVKLAVKKFKDKNNSLYVTVSLDQIKKTEFSGLGTSDVIGVAQDPPSVTISIAELMEKVNPANTTLTKYFPKTMLTEEQSEALSKESNGNKNQVKVSIEGLDKGIDPEITELATEYLGDIGTTLSPGERVDPKAIARNAAKVLNEYESKLSKDILTKDLSRLYEMIADRENPELIHQTANYIADKILRNSKNFKPVTNESQAILTIYAGFPSSFLHNRKTSSRKDTEFLCTICHSRPLT